MTGPATLQSLPPSCSHHQGVQVQVSRRHPQDAAWCAVQGPSRAPSDPVPVNGRPDGDRRVSHRAHAGCNHPDRGTGQGAAHPLPRPWVPAGHSRAMRRMQAQCHPGHQERCLGQCQLGSASDDGRAGWLWLECGEAAAEQVPGRGCVLDLGRARGQSSDQDPCRSPGQIQLSPGQGQAGRPDPLAPQQVHAMPPLFRRSQTPLPVCVQETTVQAAVRVVQEPPHKR